MHSIIPSPEHSMLKRNQPRTKHILDQIPIFKNPHVLKGDFGKAERDQSWCTPEANKAIQIIL